jgi:hypothetical protein
MTLVPILSWAVLVSPHHVFIDARSRTGMLHLINSGTTPEEVSIELKFGYPDTDSAGGIHVRLIDQPGPEHPSAARWIRAFPRRVVVPPGGRQIVRLLAEPPAGLPEGEYWSRMIVTSRGAQVGVAGADTVVRAGVSLVVSTVLAVTYRSGAVRTGVALTDFQSSVESDSLVIWLGLRREGNAAYLGTARFRLRDAGGSARGSWDSPVAVYYSLRRRYAFPLEGVSPGSYTLRLDLTTAREDIPQSSVLPAPPIERTVGVVVP